MKHWQTWLSEKINRFQGLFGSCFDKFFIQLKYLVIFRKKINWQKPQTYNEKLNVYKISTYAEKLWPYVDKITVRKFVAKKIGQKYLNKIYEVYRGANEIDLNKLPHKFVLKTNHGSGFNIIVKNKADLDWSKAKAKLSRWLNTDYYRQKKERFYKLVRPKIICEKYLESDHGQLTDYKFFCFDGRPKFIHVDVDRYTNHQRNFYDLSWKKLPVWQGVPTIKRNMPRPSGLKQMIKLSKILSAGFPHVRIDFYKVKSKIYFSEITFAQYGGMKPFHPGKFDLIFGRYFKL